jgi:hypothetical protein
MEINMVEPLVPELSPFKIKLLFKSLRGTKIARYCSNSSRTGSKRGETLHS